MAGEPKVLWITRYVKDLCGVPGDSKHLYSRVMKTKTFLFLLLKLAKHEVVSIVCLGKHKYGDGIQLLLCLKFSHVKRAETGV